MTAGSTSAETYVALLRGINVGGKNIIRMADLRSAFEAEGFRDVVTYIQSGNVIFRAPGSTPEALTTRIEEMLASAFDYQARIALRSREAMEAVVTGAPAGFGSQPDRYRYDTLFLRPPLTASAAMKEVRVRSGVDEAWAGDGGALFLAPDQPGLAELPEPARLDAGVSGDDDPQLEHDDPTPSTDVLSWRRNSTKSPTSRGSAVLVATSDVLDNICLRRHNCPIELGRRDRRRVRVGVRQLGCRCANGDLGVVACPSAIRTAARTAPCGHAERLPPPEHEGIAVPSGRWPLAAGVLF